MISQHNQSQNNQTSFYITGGTLPLNYPGYVTRDADAELLMKLQQGKFCYVFNSRQMGKSSLRLQTTKKLQDQGIACGVLDLTSLGSQQVLPSEWYLSIVRQLVSSLGLNKQFKPLIWWRDREGTSPVDRFREFIEDVVLTELATKKIVIFIDEIDKILSVPFKDDFFSLIRFFYNYRRDNPDFDRLTFCLLGVLTPSDLISNKLETPFNVGEGVNLTGFTLAEAAPLAQGLVGKVTNPGSILQDIITWTGGQPFLTQWVLNLVAQKSVIGEFQDVPSLITKEIINNWENQDNQEHLKTISERLLRSQENVIEGHALLNQQRISRVLGLYSQLLSLGKVLSDKNNRSQTELQLSGLVVLKDGYLEVYNQIYRTIFNETWVMNELNKFCPYAEDLNAWLVNHNDQSYLLQGQKLEAALAWSKDKNLSPLDYRFLNASQDLEKQTYQLSLAVKEEESRLLAEANQTLASAELQAKNELTQSKKQAKRMIGFGGTVLVMTMLASAVISVYAWVARTTIEFEKSSADATKQFNYSQLDALVVAMKTGQELRNFPKLPWLKQYLTSSPVLALQTILDKIRESNRLFGNEVVFSPKGDLLATWREDKTVRLWNLSGQQVAVLTGHQGDVNDVNFSPKGDLLATGGADKTVRLWNLSGQQVAVLKGHRGYVNDVQFSPKGDLLATGGADKTVRLWKLSGQQVAVLKGHQGDVNDVQFSPKGDLLATRGDDKTVRLWNLSGQQVAVLKGHQGYVNDVQFSPKGDLLATRGDDKTVRLWNLSGQQVAVLKGHQGDVNDVQFSPKGDLLATGGADKTVRLWNLSGQQVAVLKGHQGDVNDVQFSPKGDLLATRGADKTVRLWNLSGQQVAVLKGHQGYVNDVQFSPKGDLLATSGSDGTARLWNLSGQQVAEYEGTSIWFNHDGSLILVDGEGSINLWRVRDLDALLAQGCEWLKDYFVTYPDVKKELGVCRD